MDSAMALRDRLNALRGGTIRPLTEDTFDEFVADNRVVFVDFWADWCRPCKVMAPIVRSLARDYGTKVAFGKVDTEAEGALKDRFRIRGIPTFMMFKKGRVVERFSGVRSRKQLENKIEKWA